MISHLALRALSGLLDHLFESSLVGLVVLALIRLCRASPAALRRTLGTIGLCKFLVPAAALSATAAALGLRLGTVVPAGITLPPVEFAGWLLPATATASRSRAGVVAVVMLSVWLVVALAIIGRWLTQAAAYRRSLAGSGGVYSARLAQSLARAQALVGVAALPVPRVEGAARGPGVFGLRSPVLIMPLALEALLSDGELDSIVVHELVHLRRRDHLWAALRPLLLGLFWPSPVIWLLCRSLAAETERSCDEEVVRLRGAPREYAAGLVKAVRFSAGVLDPCVTAAAGPSVSLRLETIINSPVPKESPLMKNSVIAFAYVVAALGVFADASSSQARAASAYDVSELTVVPKPLMLVRPVYPADLHARNVAGTVLVDFVVGADGTVRNISALKASDPGLGQAAVDAVKQWKFSAGQLKGRAVAVHMQVPIVFSIDGPQSGGKS